MTAGDVHARADAARKFHETGDLVADEPGFVQVRVSLYVLAGIAASDAICGHQLGESARGQDHRQALDLLRTVRASDAAVRALGGLLDIKDSAHYGTNPISMAVLRTAERQVAAILEVMERLLAIR